MRALLVILDGAADRFNQAGATPLQSAAMPNLRSISERSCKGMMHPIAEGIAPESDAAVFSILGYSITDYTGRGTLEAYGAGLPVGSNTLALRCNFATIDSDRNILDRRAGRISGAECRKLEEAINGIDLGIPGVSFSFRATVGHRGVILFNSSDGAFVFSPQVSNADVGYVRKGSISVASESSGTRLPEVEGLDGSESAERTAKLLNTFLDKAIYALSSAELNRARAEGGLLPANAILMRDAGISLPKVETFAQKYRASSAFLAEMPVETGIAKLLGMDAITLNPEKERAARYERMSELILKNERNYDFIYAHIKGPDEPGHDGDFALKVHILEEIDAHFFSKIAALGCRICVTSDHATPCGMKAHSSDPVPLMISNLGDSDTAPFDERIDSLGSLGIINGKALLSILLS